MSGGERRASNTEAGAGEEQEQEQEQEAVPAIAPFPEPCDRHRCNAIDRSLGYAPSSAPEYAAYADRSMAVEGFERLYACMHAHFLNHRSIHHLYVWLYIGV